MNSNVLYVSEIITTFSGEAGYALTGEKIILVRLQGCNLKCSYCDTPKTQDNPLTHLMQEMAIMSVEELSIKLVDLLKGTHTDIRTILITGGEPLLQQEALSNVIKNVLDNTSCVGRKIKFQIETNGTILPYLLMRECFIDRICYVVDVKNSPKDNYKISPIILYWMSYANAPDEAEKLNVIFKIPLETSNEASIVSTYFTVCNQLVDFANRIYQNKPMSYVFMFSLINGDKCEEGIRNSFTRLLLGIHRPFRGTPLENATVGINTQVHKLVGYK